MTSLTMVMTMKAEAIEALKAFRVKDERIIRSLLSMWVHYEKLSAREVEQVVKHFMR